MTKPLIGLTTSRMPNPLGEPAYGMNITYARSISSAGGLPILIPLNLSDNDLEVLISRLDGILLTGGYDINPHVYGNPTHPKLEGIDSERDRVEIHLVQRIIHLGMSFLGICRGFQVINVALGGTLFEDLQDQFASTINHDQHHQPRNYLAHPVALQSDSALVGIIGENPVQVNSLHHQGLKALSADLNAVAHAPDGLIEAVELPSYPFGMAVQWHPEELQEHEPMRRLFQTFIQACKNR